MCHKPKATINYSQNTTTQYLFIMITIDERKINDVDNFLIIGLIITLFTKFLQTCIGLL